MEETTPPTDAEPTVEEPTAAGGQPAAEPEAPAAPAEPSTADAGSPPEPGHEPPSAHPDVAADETPAVVAEGAPVESSPAEHAPDHAAEPAPPQAAEAAPAAESAPAAEAAPAPEAEAAPAPESAPAAEAEAAPAPEEVAALAAETAEAAAPAAEAAEAAAPAAEAAEAAAPDAGEAAPPAEGEGAPGDRKPRQRKRNKSKVAAAWGISPTAARNVARPAAEGTIGASAGAPQAQGQGQGQPSRGGRDKKAPLPIDELRDAARACLNMHDDTRTAVREAMGVLAEKERRDIARLVADYEDVRPRARAIAIGSLAAGKLGKALAAQEIAFARLEDLWPVTLSKEEAAERSARVRGAKERDARRAKRMQERDNRQDRISKEDLAKARDGRVGASIRFVIAGEDDRDRDREKRGKKKTEDQPRKKTSASDLLDRLGY